MYNRLLVTFIALMLLSGTSIARSLEHVQENIDAEGAKELNVDIDFALGRLEIYPADIKEAVIAGIDYAPRKVDYEIDYYVRGKTGHLSMESIQHRKKNIDTDDNQWDLKFSTKYPTELNIDAGACEVDIELGGIPLTEFSLDIGAASGEIEFSEPNPQRMEDMDIEELQHY